jgi:hypothetical protein
VAGAAERSSFDQLALSFRILFYFQGDRAAAPASEKGFTAA